MLRCRVTTASLVVVVLTASGIAVHAETRGLVELFTSQGCSSCPPADKLLSELAADPSLVALSVPIDYWDYLGWKDTLALPAHANRQRAYAHVRGDRQVYTPQIVVNGSVHVLGSDRAAVEHAIAQTDHGGIAMALPIALAVGVNTLSVKVAASDGEHAVGEVWLCPLSHAVTVAIGRGENHGRTITYHNVVRRWVKLGDWSGKEASWTVPLSDVKAEDIDGAAVMVQEGSREKPGIVLGAALTSLSQPMVAQPAVPPVTVPMFAEPTGDTGRAPAHPSGDAGSSGN
jgi:hypothetical protein